MAGDAQHRHVDGRGARDEAGPERVPREALYQRLGLLHGLAPPAGDVAHGPLDDAGNPVRREALGRDLVAVVDRPEDRLARLQRDPRGPGLQGLARRRKSARGITTVSALSWMAFDRASVMRMPRSSIAPSPCRASPELLPVEPDQLRPAEHGRPEAQRQERGVAAADVRATLRIASRSRTSAARKGLAWRSTSTNALTR